MDWVIGSHPVFFVGDDADLGERLARSYESLILPQEYRVHPQINLVPKAHWNKFIPKEGPGLAYVEMTQSVEYESALIQDIRHHNPQVQVVLMVDASMDYFQVAQNCGIGNIIRKQYFDEPIIRALTIRLLSGNIFGFGPYFVEGFTKGPIIKTFQGQVKLEKVINECFDTFIPEVPPDHQSLFKCFLHELITNTLAYAIGGISAEDRDTNLTPAPNEIFIPERKAVKLALVGDKEKNAISVSDSSGNLSMLRILQKLRRHAVIGEEKLPPGMWDGSGRGMSLIQKDSRLVVNILKGVRTESIFMRYHEEELNRFESVIITEVSPLQL